VLGVPAGAAELSIKFELPQLKVAEYHRPYVAVWLERADQSFAANLAVWYDVKMQNNKGNEWLKDMRQWWRKSGRELQLPVDGLSSATRAPGEHQLVFNTSKAPLKDLPAGDYRVVVEAAREVGGRELIAVPFQWPAKVAQNAAANGTHELGKVTVNIKP
jgi:hypothetical protein